MGHPFEQCQTGSGSWKLTCRRLPAPGAPPPNAPLHYSSVSSTDSPPHQGQSPEREEPNTHQKSRVKKPRPGGAQCGIKDGDSHHPIGHLVEPVGLVETEVMVLELSPDEQARLLSDRRWLEGNTLK